MEEPDSICKKYLQINTKLCANVFYVVYNYLGVYTAAFKIHV